MAVPSNDKERHDSEDMDDLREIDIHRLHLGKTGIQEMMLMNNSQAHCLDRDVFVRTVRISRA